MATAQVRRQILQPSLFRIPALGCRTPMFSTHFKCLYIVPDSHGAQQGAVRETIFAIGSQSKPCLTLIAGAMMQKHVLRFCRRISAM
jgi:hypothetical protein